MRQLTFPSLFPKIHGIIEHCSGIPPERISYFVYKSIPNHYPRYMLLHDLHHFEHSVVEGFVHLGILHGTAQAGCNFKLDKALLIACVVKLLVK